MKGLYRSNVGSIFRLILINKGASTSEENLVQNDTPKTYSQSEDVLEKCVDYGAVIKTSMGI
ncbi:MAG TPA: hypothetical protein P5059_01155 [Candidatus Dojkabacteria bacterium]|jgi:hypothetical protein|nr:hypothetical protein [Candidatus Dojkabacteria bacterium]